MNMATDEKFKQDRVYFSWSLEEQTELLNRAGLDVYEIFVNFARPGTETDTATAVAIYEQVNGRSWLVRAFRFWQGCNDNK